MNYNLQDSLLTLPPPPSVDELEKIRHKLAMSFKDDLLPEPSRSKIQTVTVATGWSPAPASASNEDKGITHVIQRLEKLFQYD